MKGDKILLVNSYAVNNGDMALVVALYEQLVARGYTVNIATFYYDFLSKHYPQLPLLRELLDYSFLPGSTLIKKAFLKLNYRFNSKYRNHTAFISSPGGYVNSYYGIKRSLLPLITAKRSNKKTAIYSQSIGPLNSRDKNLLTEFSKSIDYILVRDDYSRACIDSIPCHSNIIQTKDAAFLLPPRPSRAGKDCKKVAVSVREWKHDKRNMNNFHQLIKTLCLLSLQQGYSIEFISTCQGVKDYRDDSKEAAMIADDLKQEFPEWAAKITVDTSFHTYYELIELLNTRYVFTIGTRLHMCILSLINGTPAFNISYEVKGIECYKYLGLSNYSADFNEGLEDAALKFKVFLENNQVFQQELPEKIIPIHEESKKTLDTFLNKMNL